MAEERKRVRKGSVEYKQYQAAAARLMADKRSIDFIGDKLGVARATVARYLTDNEFLQREVRYLSTEANKYGPQFMTRVDELVGELGLRDALSALNPHRAPIRVKVVYPEGIQQKYETEFAQLAAPRFAKWLARSRKSRPARVGVCWGGTISELVAPAAKHIGTLRKRPKKIEFMPLSGIISANPDATYFSSTNVALRLSKDVNRALKRDTVINVPIYNLNCIPMRFPRGFGYNETHHSLLREYLDNAFPDYVKIFGPEDDGDAGPRTPAYSVTTIVAGIGGHLKSRLDHLDAESHFPVFAPASGIRSRPKPLKWQKRNVTKERLLKEIIDGDIAGILLTRPQPTQSLQDAADQIVDALNARLATLRASHLYRCASRSTDKTRNGVIVVAVGAHKAEALIRAIQSGYVSRIIIDSKLATELIKILRKSND